MEVLLASGNWRIFTELETVVDPIEWRQCRRQREANAKGRPATLLQENWENVGCVGEKVRPEVFRRRVLCQLGQIFDQFRFGIAPSEVAIRLGEPDLGQGLLHLRAREGLRKEYRVRPARLDLADQPLPERQRFGVRIVDAKSPYPLADPEQDRVAQFVPH